MKYSKDVEIIQQLLNKYNDAKLKVDGIKGELTKTAIDNALKEEEKPGLPPIPAESHFSDEEFKCRDGTLVPNELKPNYDLLKNTVLEVIRHEQGDIPLKIVSGYRTQAYNDKIYKKTNTHSMHILAGAADIKSDIGFHELGKICKNLYDKGIIGGLGLGLNMIHVDVRHLVEYANRKAIWYYGGFKDYNDWEKGF